MMDQFKIVGFGYFGKPETVARVFQKTVETYTVSYDIPQLSRFQNDARSDRINGFSLGFEDEVLNLSIFAADAEQNRKTYRHHLPIRKNSLN